MTAYMIVLREGPVRDAGALAEYGRQNRENAATFVADHGLRPLAIYGGLTAIEGAVPDGAVVLQFPSVADAQAWYDSPAYQSALPDRLRAADYRMFIVEGL